MFNLVQALHETRALADDHPDDDAWVALRDQVDVVLGQLTADDPAGEPIEERRVGRLVREDVDVDVEEAELAAAALMAVHDRPEEEQLELARAAVEDLADALN